MSGPARPALSLVPDEPDQVTRLNRFRAAHPGIAIRAGLGYWQALVAERDSEIVLTRYQLKDLLDKLDTLIASPAAATRRARAGPGQDGDHPPAASRGR